MPLKNSSQFEAIQQDIANSISEIYRLRADIAPLSDARSIQKRQGEIDTHISNISTKNAQLAVLIEETNKPTPRKKKAEPEPEQPVDEPTEPTESESE